MGTVEIFLGTEHGLKYTATHILNCDKLHSFSLVTILIFFFKIHGLCWKCMFSILAYFNSSANLKKNSLIVSLKSPLRKASTLYPMYVPLLENLELKASVYSPSSC